MQREAQALLAVCQCFLGGAQTFVRFRLLDQRVHHAIESVGERVEFAALAK